MAYTTINKSTDHFNTKLYTGNDTGQSITGVGFQPDWVWIKSRTSSERHCLNDAVRGVYKELRSNETAAESDRSSYGGLSAFGSDGFTVGNDDGYNDSLKNYASWNWKAGTTGSGTSTGSGTGKAYSYSVNTTSGFSIVKYVGNGSAGHTIPHHLGQAPTFTIVKALGLTESWQIICAGLDADKFIQLNSTSAEVSQSSYNRFNSTRPSSTVVTLGSDDHTNKNDNNFIMYNFCNVDGFSKSGSYTGNNNADGSFIFCGFKPAFVIVKRTGATDSWRMVDNKRDVSNTHTGGSYRWLYPNANSTEASDNASGFDFLSNGFKVRSTSAGVNANGENYIYMAFGQSLVGSNNIPCTAV